MRSQNMCSKLHEKSETCARSLRRETCTENLRREAQMEILRRETCAEILRKETYIETLAATTRKLTTLLCFGATRFSCDFAKETVRHNVESEGHRNGSGNGDHNANGHDPMSIGHVQGNGWGWGGWMGNVWFPPAPFEHTPKRCPKQHLEKSTPGVYQSR